MMVELVVLLLIEVLLTMVVLLITVELLLLDLEVCVTNDGRVSTTITN
jgi:hypothetical protein